ncbi:type IV pilus biogenesis protein PilM [Pseudomonas viridiflava]|uniref:type IV pilus biogenesis protein PilM n=1 Tax=Pseudomonas viridiflava TaxID=33069 RepID=UPI002EA35C44|nr:type IV pilus biogenesis protein PilM [Pseudomonas viridiflava]
MLVYRNALAEYAYAHQTASGPVQDSQLDLPNWYFRYSGVEGVVAAGKSYAFYSSPPPGLVAEMVNLTSGSLAIGTASSGNLEIPSTAMILLKLPTAIPNGT